MCQGHMKNTGMVFMYYNNLSEVKFLDNKHYYKDIKHHVSITYAGPQKSSIGLSSKI